MQEAVSVLLKDMPERGSQLNKAEEIDKIICLFKRFIISSKTTESKQKGSEIYFIRRNKGKGRADSVEPLSDIYLMFYVNKHL